MYSLAKGWGAVPAALPIGYFPMGEEDAVDLSRTARTTTVCASSVVTYHTFTSNVCV